MPGRRELKTPCFGSTFAAQDRSDIVIFPPAGRELPTVTSSAHWDGAYADQRNCMPERNCSRSGRPRRPHAPGQRNPGPRQTGSGPAPSAAGPPPRAARRGTRRTPPAGRDPGQPAGPVTPAGKCHAPRRLSHLTQDPPCRATPTPQYTAPPLRGFNWISNSFLPNPVVNAADHGLRVMQQ